MRRLLVLAACLLLAWPVQGTGPDLVVSNLRAEVDATVAAHPEQAGRIDTAAWPADAHRQMLLAEAGAQQVGRLRVAVVFGLEPGQTQTPWTAAQAEDAVVAWLQAESSWARAELDALSTPGPERLHEAVYRAWAPTTALLHIPFALNRVEKDPFLDLTDPEQVLDLLGPVAACHVLADHLPPIPADAAATPAGHLAAITAAIPPEVAASRDRDVATAWKAGRDAQARGAVLEGLVWALQAYHAHVYARHADPGRAVADDPVPIAERLNLDAGDHATGGRLAAEMLADWRAKRAQLPPRAVETVAAQIVAWAAVDAVLAGRAPPVEDHVDRDAPLAHAALVLALVACAWRRRTAMHARLGHDTHRRAS